MIQRRRRLTCSTALVVMVVGATASGCGDDIRVPAATFSDVIEIPGGGEVRFSTLTRVDASLTSPTEEVQEVEFRGNVGTLVVGGVRAEGFIRRSDSWPQAAQTLHFGLAVSDGSWHPFWIYCDGAGRLTRLYYETSSRGEVVDVVLDGACTASTASQLFVAWPLPAHEIRQVHLASGFEVTDPDHDVELSSKRPGRADGDIVLVFTHVDCRSCVIDWQRGWSELHALIWHNAAKFSDGQNHVSFGIVNMNGMERTGQGASLQILTSLPVAYEQYVSWPNARWRLDL